MVDVGSAGPAVPARVKVDVYPAGGFRLGRFFVGFGLLMVLLILLGLLWVLYYVYASSASAPAGAYSPLANVTDVTGVPVAAVGEEAAEATTSTLRADDAVVAADPIRVRRVTEICQAVYSEGGSDGRIVCRNITVWEDPETGKKYSGQYNIVVH